MRCLAVAAVAAVVAMVACGCGHAPPPPPAPVEKPVASLADLAGTWVRDDDMGWFYTLTIGSDGGLVQNVERERLGRCDQKGTLAAGDAPKHFKLTLTADTCSELGDAASTTVNVESFTGDALVVVVGAARRAYRRDPNK